MKTIFAAVALAAALVQPAAAVTFPSLTTIYVGSGVTDSGDAAHVGVATTFMCTNVSGKPAAVRFLVLSLVGTVVGSLTTGIQLGQSAVASTHGTLVFNDAGMSTGIVQGVVNIESTESAMFCTALIVDASSATPAFSAGIHLVPVNPHPGTVE